MRFTRLRLNGFKSFVDPTELVIHDGLTGIVGPNGCGKSNLLEALRWVMGENRPTAMRGSGMEDVVFAGSGMRRARAFAEVALSLDNSERLAPAGFNDSDQLEVSRRLTRDAGSAYRINGKEVRARDVQMLFADASTGAHSPALVRQGQISELINARPRARRRVLEEAAGISGLYQRRHEAELRLSATETNLARVGDTIDTLAQQLATLSRQARQAARYREIGTALRRAEGMLLCRRLREAEATAQARRSELAEASATAACAEREARTATSAREEAEGALPALREEEAIAGAVLQRLTVRREALDAEETRARQAVQELGARIEQLRRDAEREAALVADADETVSRLEWEAAALDEAVEGHEARLAEAESAAQEAREAAAEAEAQLAEATESLAELAARHQALERQAGEARAAARRIEKAEAEAREQAAGAEVRLQAAQEAQQAAETEAEVAQARLDAAEEALAETEVARAGAETAEAEARSRRAEAEGAAGALAAEARALERVIAQEARPGTALLDAVRVAPGLEAALGAALGADLDLPSTGEGSGWHALPALDNPPPLPAGAEPLSTHVQAPPELARRLSQLGLVAASDAPALHAALRPGQRLVTREGDLWRWDGLMQRAEDAPSAAALRLAQINRLEALRADLDEAQALADEAAALHDAGAAALATAVAADRAARDARRGADNRLSEARRALSRAEAEASQAMTRRGACEAEAQRLANAARDAAA
ncbi:MAG: AAA family ATPase, partial [Pararhodobacter sp.]|nr:AAA family ATPase [Pararhodobacter sp.]